jgi:hypothetical protein
MSKKDQNVTQQFYNSILIVLYLGIGFIPNLTAVDQIAPQWLYLNGLNLITLLYLYLNRVSFRSSIKLLLNTRFLGFMQFLCFGQLSRISTLSILLKFW